MAKDPSDGGELETQSAAGEDNAVAATGFAIETHLETGLVQLDSDSALSLPQAGLFLGHRGPSATFGIGLELSRLAHSLGSPPTGNDSAVTSIMIVPGVRVPLARSADGRTELLGELDAGYGVMFASSSGASSSDSVHMVRARVAPGLRYWVAPSFAVGAIAGIRYDRSSLNDNSYSATGLFSSLVLTGVF